MINLTFQQRCQQVGLYEGSLFAWLDKVEQLTKENARLRAALEKIAGIRGRDLSEPWSDAELAEIALKGQP